MGLRPNITWYHRHEVKGVVILVPVNTTPEQEEKNRELYGNRYGISRIKIDTGGDVIDSITSSLFVDTTD